MSAAVTLIVAATGRTVAFRARALPFFAGPYALPPQMLTILDAMLASGATAEALFDLAHALRTAGCSLRALDLPRAAEPFFGLAEEVAREAEARR